MRQAWRAKIGRARQRLRERAFTNLALHFFERLFAGEAISAESDLRLGIGGILILLSLPGAFLPILLLPKYSSLIRWISGQKNFDFNIASMPDKYMLLTLSMVITGIVAALKWDELFPDRLDSLNLSPLPINVLQIFTAKFCALLAFVGLFIFAVNAASTVLFPLVVLGDQTDVGLGLRFSLAHAVATASGSAFMFFSIVALAGLLLTILPQRWFRKISTAVQGALVASLVALLLFTPEIAPRSAEVMATRHRMLSWLPTEWYLGLYQEILGRGGAEVHALSARAVEALVGAFVISLAFYAASYPRYFRRIPEMTEAASKGPSRARRLAIRWFDGVVLRDPFDRACFHFAAKTLARSPRHRLLLSGFVGLGAAIAIQDAATDASGPAQAAMNMPSTTQLSAGLAIAFFLVCGLSFVFKIPAELPANWAFRVTGEWRSDAAQRVARKLVVICLAPLILGIGGISATIWGPRLGLAHASYVLLASLLLLNVLLISWRKIPFTCSYSAGKQNPGLVLPIYLVAFIFFSGSLASLEHSAITYASAVPFFVVMGILAGVVILVRRYAYEFGDSDSSLIFEDKPEPVVQSMDLR
jgi:hypothetical protein